MADEQSWSDLILPFAVGATSLAGGFAAGRNPGVDNPGATFLQAAQIPALIEQRLANVQHQKDIAGYYQNLYGHQQATERQQQLNTGVTSAKQLVEMGDVAGIDASKDTLGTYYPVMRRAAQSRRDMLIREGWLTPEQPAAQPIDTQTPPGAVPVPQGGPANAPPPVPQGIGNGIRPEVTRSLNVGGMTTTRKVPGTSENERITGFLGNYGMGALPSFPQVQADLQRENARLRALGQPTIPWTEEANKAYMARLQWERPDLWRRLKLTEQAAQMPAQVAGRALGQEGGDPYQQQSDWEIGQAAKKETQVGTAQGQVQRQFARLPETERKVLDEQDNVTRTAAAIMDLAPRIMKKYGNNPAFLQRNLTAINEQLGTQDPELARFIRLNGLLYTAARNRISGTAVGKNEEKALNTYISDPTGNPITVMQGVQEVFRTGLLEQGRNIQRAQSYGGEDLSVYSWNQIAKRRAAGQPLFPELSAKDEIGGAGDVTQPNLIYNPATKRIEPQAK